MRLASELAGFTLGQADELRRAMGKKDAAKMQAQRDASSNGCASAASPRRRPRRSSSSSSTSPATGSPKAHSTTYALLAYQTAYLKANYPRHFMAALLTIESQNSDKVALYLAECRELGVPVLPPDINASELAFVVAAGRRRFGLGAVKGAGEGAIRSILDARKALGGAITSLFALAEHVDLRLVNKKVLECLVKAGAFDSLAPGGRRRLSARGGRGCSPASTGSSTTAAAIRRIAIRGSRSCSAATTRPAERRTTTAALPAGARRGRRPRRWRSKRRRSGST